MSLTFETSPEEEFWKVKMERYIEGCDSVYELKQIATLLVKLAATRQCVIKGLVKDSLNRMESELRISS
jgi:hypothetical protein